MTRHKGRIGEEEFERLGLLVGVALRPVHVHVRRIPSRHLELLDGTHASMREEHKDVDVLATRDAGNGGRPSVARCLHNHVCVHTFCTEYAAQQPGNYLLSNVLEGERRSQTSVKQVDAIHINHVGADWQWRIEAVIKSGERLAGDCFELWQRQTSEELHHASADLCH